jgi:hypothetical protein
MAGYILFRKSFNVIIDIVPTKDTHSNTHETKEDALKTAKADWEDRKKEARILNFPMDVNGYSIISFSEIGNITFDDVGGIKIKSNDNE